MPYIKEESAQRIKEYANIYDVVKDKVDLKKEGANFKGCCPFHNEKTPSFVVSPTRGIYKCFGCGKGGDAVNFLMDIDQLSYVEALERLAPYSKETPEYDNSEKAREKASLEKRRSSLSRILEAAMNHYREALFNVGDHSPARDALRLREYDRDQVIEWGIGFAPGGTFLYDKLKDKNLLAEGRELGLVGDNSDKFWNRLIYPIHDRNGLLVGIAGRDVTGDKKTAKWINSKDSDLYHKEKVLFGLFQNRSAITKKNEAWLVEGYNDVITPAVNGINLMVASCGTAIGKLQARQLKRYCSKVVISTDPDDAGTQSALKAIPIFFREGFSVYVHQFEEGMDPDLFFRNTKDSKGEFEKIDPKDGFFFLIDYWIPQESNSPQDMSRGLHVLVDILKDIEDTAKFEFYLKELCKRSGLREAAIKDMIRKRKEEVAANELTTQYIFPRGIAAQSEELTPIADEYGMIIAGNRIWMVEGEQRPYSFRKVSNFSIEYLQHIQDEKNPSKLVRITNTKGRTSIFDALNVDLNTPQKFDDTVSGFGNYLWTGNRQDFIRLRRYLYDRMGSGSRIDVLGWQPDGFWVFNNKVIIPGEAPGDLNEDGVLKIKDQSYYIPSANGLYKNNPKRFMEQKKIQVYKAKFTFQDLAAQMVKVHREHAYFAILHSISAMFRDIIHDRTNFFPMLMFYGPKNTGKDELVDTMLRFFGKPQSPLSISNNASTIKAKIAAFAQNCNMLVYMSEYVAGNSTTNETMKDLWGGIGYKRRTLDSSVSTEMVPILSAAVITGNQYPDDEPLISRMLIEEMLKKDFTQAEVDEFDRLQNMTKDGFSSITEDILHHRSLWEEKFHRTYKECRNILKEKLSLICSESRMINNAAIYTACYQLMSQVLQFPFTYQQLENHIIQVYRAQMRKMNTGSKVQKFWNLFLSAVRSDINPLTHGFDFSINGNDMVVNITHAYNRIAPMWWQQYQEKAPSKTDIQDMIKQDENLFVEYKDKHYYGPDKKTSGYHINGKYLEIFDDLLQLMDFKDSRKPSNDSISRDDQQSPLPF